MSAADQLNSFLTANGIARGDLSQCSIVIDSERRTVGADEMMDLMAQVNNTVQIVVKPEFMAEPVGEDDIYIRPAPNGGGGGNTWETFNPKAPLTVADIT